MASSYFSISQCADLHVLFPSHSCAANFRHVTNQQPKKEVCSKLWNPSFQMLFPFTSTQQSNGTNLWICHQKTPDMNYLFFLQIIYSIKLLSDHAILRNLELSVLLKDLIGCSPQLSLSVVLCKIELSLYKTVYGITLERILSCSGFVSSLRACLSSVQCSSSADMLDSIKVSNSLLNSQCSFS